jgi:hypothetical protein
MYFTTQKLAAWLDRKAGVLWLTSRDSLFHTVLQSRIDTAALFLDAADNTLFGKAPYDACLCELAANDLGTLGHLYAKIRPLMKDGAEVMFLVPRGRDRSLVASDAELQEAAFPDVDVSEIRFFGSMSSDILRRIYLRASRSFPNRPIFRAVATAAVLIGLAPLVRLANSLASRRDPSIFTAHWTSIVVRLTVRNSRAAGPVKAA